MVGAQGAGEGMDTALSLTTSLEKRCCYQTKHLTTDVFKKEIPTSHRMGLLAFQPRVLHHFRYGPLACPPHANTHAYIYTYLHKYQFVCVHLHRKM